MSYTYTNRKGRKYSLCASKTKQGRQRYFFTPEPKGEVLEKIPEGYEINENVNGQVSLRKIRPLEITPDEIALVQKAIMRHPKSKNYRADIKGKTIRIHEALGNLDPFFDMLQKKMRISQSRIDAMREEEENYRQFAHFLSFKLVNKAERLFRAERIEFRSWEKTWIDIFPPDNLENLVREIIPLLGTDNFYRIHF